MIEKNVNETGQKEFDEMKQEVDSKDSQYYAYRNQRFVILREENEVRGQEMVTTAGAARGQNRNQLDYYRCCSLSGNENFVRRRQKLLFNACYRSYHVYQLFLSLTFYLRHAAC